MCKERCQWPGNDELMVKYHDEEWGVPVKDDIKLFEFIVLDGFQAGLSWKTILHKRENFRRAFDNYNINKIIKYDDLKIEKLMQDKGIVRNKLKINSVIANAKVFKAVIKEYGSFTDYIWSFTGGVTIVNKWDALKQIPAKTEVSDKMSKDMVKRGFKFVGSTICYAFMQAAGLVNDHLITCYRYKEINKMLK